MSNDLVSQIIQKNIEEKAPFLDLGNCGLTELPVELLEMPWVTGLNLGDDYSYIYEDRPYSQHNRNNGFENRLDFNLDQNIEILKSMPQLITLYLKMNQISDITFLQNLKQLTSLDLAKNQISDIFFLQDLKQLTFLGLNDNQISDISFLQNLKQLNFLSLRYNQISDISFLQTLKQLTFLELNDNQISDISFLQNLKQLNWLNLTSNPILDYSFLKDLKLLRALFLNDNQISDYSFLQDLNYLNSLNLMNTQISDISILQDFKKLTWLNLSGNCINDVKLLLYLDQLTDLYLEDNPIPYIPKEIYNGDNCAKSLKSYWQELQTAQKTTNTQLKIMFIGNGCTGKTTLLHWFLDNEFKDIGIDSRTHGIFIKPLPLCDKTILGNFWDFGGQEVYHATHRLFLGRRTLYILVWATETLEKADELRHPPQYWLDIIADIADKHERSRVLIVQNLFDNQKVRNVLTDGELEDYNQRGLDIEIATVNAKTGKNIASFQAKVQEEAQDLIKTYEEELPETWVSIRTKVVERREDKDRTMSWTAFQQLCQDCELKGDPSVILGYLHRAGEVFYYKNQFDNQIILDQEWALKAVYAVLKRKRIDQFKGRFHLEDLMDIWQNENLNSTKENVQIFINFMMSNQIMFHTQESRSVGEKTEFVIPQLLPDKVPVGVKSSKGNVDNLKHRIDYAFLHRDIIERFIVRTAQFSKDKDYWRNGVFIEHDNAFAIVEVVEENNKKCLHIECFGHGKEYLFQKIREEFDKIRTLDKAKEYRFETNQWLPYAGRLVNQDKDERGFKEAAIRHFNVALPFLKAEKDKLKRLVIEGQTDSVLESIIQNCVNDKEQSNDAYLLLSEWKNIQRKITKHIVNPDNAAIEVNRINDAALKMIDDLMD